jgi:hypothetical protein
VIASTGTAWYVYGVAEAGAGLERAGTELVVDGRLAALVGEVPLDEFAEEELPQRLNDREWLERTARAHEDALAAAAAVGAVVPLRFGTVYRDRDDVAALLRARRHELESALDRVRGRVELGVKAWLDRGRLVGALGGATGSDAGDGSGRAYLQRRQDEQRLTATVSACSAELAGEAHERLCATAVDGRANRPQPPELSGRREPMLLNGAYLVEGDGEELRAEVERLASEHAALGVEYELTGPWPPHNFVDLDEGA